MLLINAKTARFGSLTLANPPPLQTSVSRSPALDEFSQLPLTLDRWARMTTFTHASWSLLTALASVAYASHARAQSLEPVPVHREARVVFCVAPCEVTLPAGTGNYAIKFANEPASSWPGAIGTLTLPAGPSTVRIEYQHRSVLRKVAGLVGVSAMGAASFTPRSKKSVTAST